MAKNKLAPPFKQTEFEITFGSGICRLGEIIDLGLRLGVLEKTGSWFKIDGNSIAQVIRVTFVRVIR